MAKKKNSKKKPHQDTPKLVSEEYLELAWSQRPLPAPDWLPEKLQAFDDFAQGLLKAQPVRVPNRVELSEIIGQTTFQLLSQAFLRQLVDWLMEPCTSEAQAQRIRFTMEILPQSRWLLEHPVLEFVFKAWGQSMPDNCRQWLPLWCGLVGEGRWATPSPTYMEQLREQMQPEQAPPRETTAPPPADQVYSWWVLSGLLLGWNRAPDDFRDRLVDRAFEDWLTSHPDFLLTPTRENCPATRKWEAIEALLMANETLLEAIPDSSLDDYLMEPEGSDWVLGLANHLVSLGRSREAYRLLQQLTQEQPDRADIRERMERLAAQSAY